MCGSAPRKRALTRGFHRRHSTAINGLRQAKYPNLLHGWPVGQPAHNRGQHAPWVGGWGDFRDQRSRVSKLARSVEKELRQRFVVKDAVTAILAKQAARCAALAECLGDQLFDGTLEAQRRTQERHVSAIRAYRKALDLLAASARRAPAAGGEETQDDGGLGARLLALPTAADPGTP